MPRPSDHDYQVLAAFRGSLRALNRAIEEGARAAGLTVQQQALLLTLRAHGGREVALATVRAHLRLDDATMADLLGRLQARGLVIRRVAVGRDRRAADIALKPRGVTLLERSVAMVRERIRHATEEGELDSLRRDMDEYFRFYVSGATRLGPARRSTARGSTKRRASRTSRAQRRPRAMRREGPGPR